MAKNRQGLADLKRKSNFQVLHSRQALGSALFYSRIFSLKNYPHLRVEGSHPSRIICWRCRHCDRWRLQGVDGCSKMSGKRPCMYRWKSYYKDLRADWDISRTELATNAAQHGLSTSPASSAFFGSRFSNRKFIIGWQLFHPGLAQRNCELCVTVGGDSSDPLVGVYRWAVKINLTSLPTLSEWKILSYVGTYPQRRKGVVSFPNPYSISRYMSVGEPD